MFNWEPWLERYIPAGGINALDVGGNEGQWCKVLCPRFKSVTCIEANPSMADALARLGFENLTVIRKAAWLHRCELEFAVRNNDLPETHTGGSAVVCRDCHRGTQPFEKIITVEGVAIDELGLPPIDFLKMDIEGGEVQAMGGATKTIERDRPKILVECHAEENALWIACWLERCGYNIHHLHGPGYDPAHDGWKKHTWLFGEPHHAYQFSYPK